MTPMTALLLFAAWTLLLVFAAVNWRVLEVLKGKPINSWGRGKAEPVPGVVTRMEHAHMNCLENLPIFAVIVLAAYALAKVPAIATFAPIVLYTRLGQSIVHLIGTSQPLVYIRATLWTIQAVLFAWMIWSLLA